MTRLQRRNIEAISNEERIHILHVDEDANIIEITKQILESEHNFDIDTALSADVALKKLEQQSFDIVITDYEMPHKNGLDLLREIKQRKIPVPVIIFTGKSREEIARTALNLGAEGYFNKQDSPELVYQEIAHGIKTIVSKRKAIQALEESEKRYYTIINQAAEIVIVHDLQGQIVDVNQQACKNLGYSIEELRSMVISDVDINASQNKYIEQIFSKANAGKTLTMESTMRRKDNSLFPIEVSIGAFVLNKEKLIVCMIRDITERKKSEEAIKRQQTLLLSINKIFEEAIRTSDDEELGQVILTLAEEVTQSKAGFIAELESGKLKDIALNIKGSDKCRVVDSKGHRLSPRIHEVHGIYGQVLNNGVSVIVNDLANYPDRIGFPKGHLSLTSFLCVPLKEGQTTIGVIGVGGRKEGYTQNEQDALETMAPAIVEAIKHKRAEAALRASEEKYREMINEMTDTSWVIDENGKFVYVNDAATRILGYSREELLSMGPSDIDENIDLEFTKQLKQLSPNKNIVFETIHTAKNGKKIPVEISSNKIMYQGKKATLSIARDITKRKEMENLLKHQKMLLTDLYENAPAIYYSLDAEQRFTSVNNTMCQLLGYTKEELLGKKVASIMTEQSKKAVLEQYPVYLKIGYINNVERQFIRKDGTVIDVVGAVSVQNPQDKKTLSIKAVYRDVTKQKQVEIMLKESNEKHRKILEIAQEGILVFDKEANIRYVNPKMGELLGYSTEEMLEKTIYHFVDPESIERFAQTLEQIKNDTKRILEAKLIRKNGEAIYTQISASPVRDETENYVGITMLVTDITERKELEKHLQKLAYQLNSLSAGSSYLCNSHERVFKAYSELTFHNVCGLCIAREDPAKLINEYHIAPQSIWLLSQKPLKGFQTLPSLQAVSLAISEFLIENKSGVVVLDGLEYLLSAFGFDAVYRFIQEKRFDFLENEALLLIPIDLATLSEREKALLTSELKLLT